MGNSNKERTWRQVHSKRYCETLENNLKENTISKENVLGVGIGVPGPVKYDGTVLKCVNLGWGIFNIVERN